VTRRPLYMTVRIDFRGVFSASNEMRPRHVRPSFGTARAFATPYSCDPRGIRTAQIDPRGTPVYFGYDALSRREHVTDAAGRPIARGASIRRIVPVDGKRRVRVPKRRASDE
jgi:YD repeat-containing protein